MTKTLLTHASSYPKMEPADAVKLIYQNEFGPGHLIANKENAMNWLTKEYESLPPAQMPLYENIGNGLVRVNLCQVEHTRLEALFEAFCRSAEEVRGDIKSFEKKLDTLRELTAGGAFSFSLEELDEYLTEYRKAGYPAVSHSQIYRDNYKPSYRVVLRRYIDEQL